MEAMHFTTYMLWKAAFIVACAFIWGMFRGFTGRSLGREPSEKRSVAKDP